MKTEINVLNELLKKLEAMHQQEEEAGEVLFYTEDFISMVTEAKENL